jgi:hypothetical protein
MNLEPSFNLIDSPINKSYLLWCGRRDSNSHGLPHWNLNPARIPISPRPHTFFLKLPALCLNPERFYNRRDTFRATQLPQHTMPRSDIRLARKRMRIFTHVSILYQPLSDLHLQINGQNRQYLSFVGLICSVWRPTAEPPAKTPALYTLPLIHYLAIKSTTYTPQQIHSQ